MKKILLFILVLVLVACSQQQEGRVYKIGVSVPLTSSAAQLGAPFLDGLKLAQKEINAVGGVNNKQIELIVEDNQNSPKEGVNVFHALEVRSPDLIISTMSTATVSLSPLAHDAGIPLIASLIFADITKANDNAIIFYPPAKEDARHTVDDLKKSSIHKVGVIYINSEYGKASLDGFVELAKENNIEVAAQEAFDGDVTDYSTPLLKIEAREPQAIYIIAIDPMSVIKYLKSTKTKMEIYTNIVPMGGNMAYKDPQIFEGVHITAPAVSVPGMQEYKAFREKVKGIMDIERNTLTNVAMGYDSLYAITAALKKNPDAKALVQTLSTYGSFTGANGKYALNSRHISMPLYPVVFKNGNLERVE